MRVDPLIPAPRGWPLVADLVVAFLDDLPDSDPGTLTAGRGLMDGDHRQGPFGGAYRVALMMDDGSVRDGGPLDGRRLASRASNRLPANVRGERRRTINFGSN
jgi:hypothetical protein